MCYVFMKIPVRKMMQTGLCWIQLTLVIEVLSIPNSLRAKFVRLVSFRVPPFVSVRGAFSEEALSIREAHVRDTRRLGCAANPVTKMATDKPNYRQAKILHPRKPFCAHALLLQTEPAQGVQAIHPLLEIT